MAFPEKMLDGPLPPGWESRCLQEQVVPAGVRRLANLSGQGHLVPLESVAGTRWAISAKGLFQSWGCYRAERVRPEPALVELNAQHRELQWRNIDYFIGE